MIIIMGIIYHVTITIIIIGNNVFIIVIIIIVVGLLSPAEGEGGYGNGLRLSVTILFRA